MNDFSSFPAGHGIAVGFNDRSGGDRRTDMRSPPAARLVPISGDAPMAFAPGEAFPELDIDYDIGDRALWVRMKPKGMPSFTPSMLDNLNRLHARLARQDSSPGVAAPLYFVGGSRTPGVFNLGGDLAYFVECIRAGDAGRLRAYAHACVDAVYACATGFGAPIITIALLEGNAFGGGLEAALSFHVAIAEKGAKFGFPEVLFGSFPGMGAYSLVSRKIGMREAQKMIRSGRIFTAEEFHDMGLIDVLAEKGEGAAAVRAYLKEHRARHSLALAHQRVKQRMEPLSRQELYDVTDIWVETAIDMSAADLRRMERILAAQIRQGA